MEVQRRGDPRGPPRAAAKAARWPGWQHLPRDYARHPVPAGVIGWTVLPHVAHLPLWCTALPALVLLWRGRSRSCNAPLPGAGWLLVLLVVAAGLTPGTHRTLLGKEAGVTLVVALMALKTLELRARRDAFVVFFLGFFVVLTQFLYSQSLLGRRGDAGVGLGPAHRPRAGAHAGRAAQLEQAAAWPRARRCSARR